jgi:AraC-like DNA-binding protein
MGGARWRVDDASQNTTRAGHGTVATAPPAPRSYVRVAAIQGLAALAAELDMDVARILMLCELPLELLDNPENLITYHELVRLLLECERQSRRDDFGLLVGMKTRLVDQGIAGQVALCSETAEIGLARYVRFFNVHDTAAVTALEQAGRLTRFSYAVCEPDLPDSRHLHYGAIAIAFNIVQDLCGADWRATEIAFTCRAPADTRYFRRFFKAPLRFNCSESAVVFESRWLARPLPGANAAIQHASEQVAAAIETGMLDDLPGVVRRLARKKLLTGNCSMEAISAGLSMHRRTLDRHLKRHGVAFEPIVAAVKQDVACHLLRETTLSLTEIAAALQYSSSENFATAFRSWLGLTPSDFRAGTATRRARSRRPRGSVPSRGM